MPEGPFITPIDPDGVNVMGPMVPSPNQDATGPETPPVVSTAKASTVCIHVAIGI